MTRARWWRDADVQNFYNNVRGWPEALANANGESIWHAHRVVQGSGAQEDWVVQAL